MEGRVMKLLVTFLCAGFFQMEQLSEQKRNVCLYEIIKLPLKERVQNNSRIEYGTQITNRKEERSASRSQG